MQGRLDAGLAMRTAHRQTSGSTTTQFDGGLDNGRCAQAETRAKLLKVKRNKLLETGVMRGNAMRQCHELPERELLCCVVLADFDPAHCAKNVLTQGQNDKIGQGVPAWSVTSIVCVDRPGIGRCYCGFPPRSAVRRSYNISSGKNDKHMSG